MTDDDTRSMHPATVGELESSLSFALRYHGRKRVHIREGCTIDTAGFHRERSADRHLKAPEEMARLFARHPAALARTGEIVHRCRFSLAELRYQYPDEAEAPGETPQQGLERLVHEAVPGRYPDGLPPDGA